MMINTFMGMPKILFPGAFSTTAASTGEGAMPSGASTVEGSGGSGFFGIIMANTIIVGTLRNPSRCEIGQFAPSLPAAIHPPSMAISPEPPCISALHRAMFTALFAGSKNSPMIELTRAETEPRLIPSIPAATRRAVNGPRSPTNTKTPK
jgi:hypothetical protein